MENHYEVCSYCEGNGYDEESYNRDAKVSFPSLGYISTFQKTDLTLLSEA